ncbi:restriction endonuclease subunit S [Pedobacter mucosus]|uniref:restriction endonuclease subunit S n=1 Tax=Pedobacter mucosus TaxID=2895286 RepID=UPI001EE43673|nr:restriction endonuclease subunit S [Pedobacter mucosus]UKT62709.1 restriction endonuclease subunit S [Pedobacter mucosus]
MKKERKNEANVPNLRFKEFDGEWKYTFLSDLGDFIGGGTPSSSNSNFWKGSIPWVSSSDLEENNIQSIKISRFITEEAINKSSTKFCEGPLVLIVSRVGVGKVAYSNESICTSQDFTNIVNFKCNGLFLSYFLSVEMKNSASSIQGTSIKGISSSEIKSKKLFIPNDEEQQKIAFFLSLIDKRITTQSKIIEELKSLKMAVNENIFKQNLSFKVEDEGHYKEWKVLKLREISKIYDGTHQTPNYVNNGIPFYSVEHLTADKFTNTKYISNQVFEKENIRVKLERGDILMTKIGNIGLAKYIDWNVKASFYVSLALIKKSDNINNEYLCYFMNSSFFQSELWKRTIHVAFPQKINLGEIGECNVMVPSQPEQLKIATLLKSLNDKLKLEIILLKRFKNQKQYLLSNLFI